MNHGWSRFKIYRIISGIACWLWICSLLPAAAAQPVNTVTLATSAIDDTFFSPPTADRNPYLFADPAASRALSVAPQLAQNKPRLYSVERVGITPKQETVTERGWQWSLATGYRQDDLKWNIQGLTPGPPFLTLPQRYSNLLSELTWKDLQILQLEFGLQARPVANLMLKGQLGYGIIFDGNNQDSDYWGDNRTFEFSRSLQDSDDGDTWDVSAALGYDIPLLSKHITFTPLVGLSYHGQNLTMQNGVQVISDYGWLTPLGPFAGLNSSYDARWYGPWIGGDIGFSIPRSGRRDPAHRLWFGVEWHFHAEYEANAYWNLRDLRFEHEADGEGWVLTGGYSWFIDSRWALDLKGKYQKWETEPGIDRLFFSDGTSITTPLNEVLWDSYAATIGISCRW